MTERATRGPRPTGRRPGATESKGVIAEVARRHFAERGFAAATLRAIAAEADVDPALIVHHFGSKRALFLEVLELPQDLAARIGQALDGPVESLPQRLSGVLVAIFSDETQIQRVEALIRTAASDEAAAATIRDFIAGQLVGPIAARLREGPGASPAEAELRATMIGTAVAGTILGRRVLRIEPLASADARTVAGLLERTIAAQLPPLPPVPPTPDSS